MDAGGEYRVVLEVPGAQKEKIEVAPGPVAGTLVVRVEARDASPGQAVVRSERGMRSGAVRYERVVPVAWDADADAAKTSFENGLLTVTMPKRRAEEAKTRTKG